MNSNEFSKKEEKIRALLFYVLTALLLFWPLFFVGRGIDITDTEYYLAHYKWGIRFPALIDDGMPLTDILGGMLYAMIGNHHLLILRLLDVAANWLICLCIYRMVGKKQNSLLILAMLVGEFFLRVFPMTLSYNTFSTLFCAAAMLALTKGLQKDRPIWIFVGAVVAGINTLFRLPNLLQATMILAIPIYGWMNASSGRKIGKNSLVFVGGYALGLLGGVLFISLFKSPRLILEGYFSLAELGAKNVAENPHSIKTMLITTIMELIKGGILCVGLAGLSAVVCWSLKKIQKDRKIGDRQQMLQPVITGAVLAVVSSAILQKDLFLFCDYTMALACLTGLLTLLCFHWFTPLLGTIGFLLGCSAMYMALGTSNALYQFVIFGGPIVGLTVMLLKAGSELSEEKIKKYGSKCLPQIRFVSLALLTTLILQCGIVGGQVLFHQTFGDQKASNLTVPVHAPELAGMKTRPDQAEMLDSFYEDISDPAFEGYPMAITESFCVGYVLADNEPFFTSLWPNLASYSEVTYQQVLEDREAKGELPIIVIHNVPYKARNSAEKTEMLWELARRNDYACVAQHRDYQILVPRDCFEKMEDGVDLGLAPMENPQKS